MKVVGLACAIALGVNSVHVREEQHEIDYSRVPNWQRVCSDLHYIICGFIDKDCQTFIIKVKGTDYSDLKHQTFIVFK